MSLVDECRKTVDTEHEEEEKAGRKSSTWRRHRDHLIKSLKLRQSLPDVDYPILIGQTFESRLVLQHELAQTQAVYLSSRSGLSVEGDPVDELDAVEVWLYRNSIPSEVEQDREDHVGHSVGEVGVRNLSVHCSRCGSRKSRNEVAWTVIMFDATTKD